MAKKLKKVKQGMSLKTKNILVNSFKGIISNQACIDNGKEAPWWLAILFLLFAIIIPLIPNYVAMNNAYGSNFLGNGYWDTDRGLANTALTLKKDGKELKVESNHLYYYEGGAKVDLNPLDDEIQLYQDTATIDAKTEIKFTTYYTAKVGKGLNTLVSTLKAKTYRVGSTTPITKDDDDWKTAEKYTPSFMVLTPNTVRMYIYKYHSTKAAATAPEVFNWGTTPNCDLVERLLTPLTKVKDKDGNYVYGQTTTEVANNVSITNLPTEVKSKVLTVWKQIFNETYTNYKEVSKWNNTLIYLGVYAGLMLFLGLMIFLLTRGKNNPFRVLNFWVCQKIGYFLSFTPAVLALIVGFIFSTNIIGQMAFIMLISLRVMWASMRQLRPVY